MTDPDTTPNELGVKFESAASGYIRGIRFYKSVTNTGTHVGNLWTLGGSNLVTVIFTGETASGWQEQWFPAPVPILSNTTYVASYHAPNGAYSIDANYFAGQGHTNHPLRALPSGVAGGNGVYAASATSIFPTDSFEDSNYWVDVVYVDSLFPDTNAPMVVSVSPTNGATDVSINTSVKVVFNEAMSAATINSNTIALEEGAAGFSLVAVDAVSTGSVGEGILDTAISSLSVTHTTGTAQNRLMLVGAAFEDDNTANFSITAVEWIVGASTQAVTRVAQQAPPSEAGCEVWSLVNPASGTGTVRLTVNSGTADGDALFAGVTTFTGVNQSTPLGNAVTNAGIGTGPSVVVPSSSGELIFDTVAVDNARAVVVGTNQTLRWSGISGVANSDGIRGASSTEPGAASVTMSWSTTSDDWAICAVPIKPAVLLGGAIAASVSYNANTLTATLQPFSQLGLDRVYTARVKGGASGVKDLATNALAADYLWSFTTANHLPDSLWETTAIPVLASENDSLAYELGVKFQSAVSGYVQGIRFYKGATNTGTHVGNLWTLGGSNLAAATFTNETATGWQEQQFAVPVFITSNTTYVASYHAPNGSYAIDSSYFTGKGYTNYPLRALPSGEAGANGVYTPSSVSAFPTNSFEDANYWVDVVFAAQTGPDTNAPVVTSVTPANGATGVNILTAVTVQFNEPVSSASIHSNTITLLTAASNAVPATVSYSAGTFTATLQPAGPLSTGETYTARVKGGSAGVKDPSTNALAADYVWSFTVVNQFPSSLWEADVAPELASVTDTNAYELGVKFQSAVSGYIQGVRFYKGLNNTGTHIGNLWTLGGSNLAVATFNNETATGWQEQWFAVPVPIASNTTYIASYHAPNGGYAIGANFFTGTGHTNYPLRALPSEVAGGNGVFKPTTVSDFPNDTFEDSNYWVDVIYTKDPLAPLASFLITSITVSNGAARITWDSVSNRTYRLEYKDEITNASWTEVPVDVLATGPSTSTTNSLGGAPRRFYRVK